MNTAASDGENVPREYPSEQYGSSVQSGCTIVFGGGYDITGNQFTKATHRKDVLT